MSSVSNSRKSEWSKYVGSIFYISFTGLSLTVFAFNFWGSEASYQSNSVFSVELMPQKGRSRDPARVQRVVREMTALQHEDQGERR